MATSSVTIPTDSFYYAKRWIGMLFIGVSVIVLSLDNTILNIALPSIARELNASNTELQWIIDGYILVFASLLLTMGTLGDRIGRKRALQTGLVLFGIGSLGAALSPNTLTLTAARMFLGVAGALMLPATLSLVSATFQPHERPQAIATWASLFGLGVGIGPVVGGFLVQNLGWHAVFLINLPVVAIAVIGGQIYLGETKEPNAPPPDIVGSVLSIIGLFALIYGIIEAGVLGWDEPVVLTALGAAVIFLAAFGIWEARTPHPMLPLVFFRSPAFTGANVTLTLLSFSLFGSIFFVPQFLQSILGYPAFTAGLMILPLAITLTFVTARSAWVSRRLGTKRTVALGVGLAGTAFLYMSLVYQTNTTYFPWVLIAQVIQASGIGLAISPATTAIMSSVPVTKAGVGSAMNDTTRQMGGALGVAVLGAIATSVYLNGVAPLQGTLSPEAYREVAAGLQTAISPATQALLNPGQFEVVAPVVREAFMSGMKRSFFVGAMVMYAAVLFALAVLPDVIKSSRVSHTPEAEAAPVEGGD
jgi:EmrB/QacA subfamily drug resistance transporter